MAAVARDFSGGFWDIAVGDGCGPLGTSSRGAGWVAWKGSTLPCGAGHAAELPLGAQQSVREQKQAVPVLLQPHESG